VFTVAGYKPVSGADGLGRRAGTGAGLEADVFLDFRLATSIEVLTPLAILALPGLLVLLSLAAQLAGGALWIPLTRRLLGVRDGVPWDPSRQ
jgi:hypothetical protein